MNRTPNGFRIHTASYGELNQFNHETNPTVYYAKIEQLGHSLMAQNQLGVLPKDYGMHRTYNPDLAGLLYLYAAYPPTPDRTIRAVFRSALDRAAYLREMDSAYGEGINPVEPVLDGEPVPYEDLLKWRERHVIVNSDEDWHRMITCATLKVKYNDVAVIRVQPFAHYDEELHRLMQDYQAKLDKGTSNS